MYIFCSKFREAFIVKKDRFWKKKFFCKKRHSQLYETAWNLIGQQLSDKLNSKSWSHGWQIPNLVIIYIETS